MRRWECYTIDTIERVLNDVSTIATVLAALYLRGIDRPTAVPNARWPGVLRAIRQFPEDPGEALRRSGFWLEAACLQHPGVLEEARRHVRSRRCLTVVDTGYPNRWIDVLGPKSPAAVWVQGDTEILIGRDWMTMVGSRSIDERTADYVQSVSLEGVRLGRGIVSGGAKGCDALSVWTAGRVGAPTVQVLPFGLELALPRSGSTLISVCSPREPFGRAAAMERNALLYAFSPLAFVGHTRFRQGGTWHSATDALRRRLTRIALRDTGDIATRALVALGAERLQSPVDLVDLLSGETPVPALFQFG